MGKLDQILYPDKVRSFYGNSIESGITSPSVSGMPSTGVPAIRASGGNPYDAASYSRRMVGYNPSRLGPTSVLWGTHDTMLARCRDERRNNPWAASAVDNAESQWVGNGIKPHWKIEDRKLKEEIERKFNHWAKTNHFYQKQAIAAREIFEAGEVFARLHVRPTSWGLRVPFEIELLESEQVPIFLNTPYGGGGGVGLAQDMPRENALRAGIEFDPGKRIVAYHMYREHPGEGMYFPMGGLTYVRVPAAQIVHAFKPVRAGLLRGEPHLGPVLTLLHEIGKYSDATVIKKTIQTMFAGFITKLDPNSDILPIDTGIPTGSNSSQSPFAPVTPSPYNPYDPGVKASRIEPGTMNELLPGEGITFPSLPQDNDLQQVLSVWLHEFAVGCGATYEQLTGDLRGVNLSSIRAGILDFRRKCEQLQRFILIGMFAEPIVCRWVKEAVIAGELVLPGYANDPSLYEDIAWGLPGWPWLDPVKDAEANQLNVRNGFTARETVCAESGEEAAVIDAQQVADHEREDDLGLVYDCRPDLILIGRESEPTVPESDQANEDLSKSGQDKPPAPRLRQVPAKAKP